MKAFLLFIFLLNTLNTEVATFPFLVKKEYRQDEFGKEITDVREIIFEKFNVNALRKNNFIIDSKTDYESFCNDYCHGNIPEINFQDYTLLGVRELTGGCGEPVIKAKFYINEIKKSYTYYSIVEEQGNCRALYTASYWVIVPKIRRAYKIDFLSNNK